jgi:hypothetical protein
MKQPFSASVETLPLAAGRHAGAEGASVTYSGMLTTFRCGSPEGLG